MQTDIDLKRFSNQFTSYTELRLQENRSEGIGFLNGDMISNSKSAAGGISARVFDKGAWGFSCGAELSDDSISRTIQMATKNAEFLSSRSGRDGAVLPPATGHGNSDFTRTSPALSQEEKIAFLKKLDNYIVRNCPEVKSRSLNMSCLDMEKQLFTSDGAGGHNITTRSIIMIRLTTENDQGQPVELFSGIGERGQFEDVFSDSSEVEATIDKLYNKLLDKKNAARPEAGHHDVILDSDLAGILAHEAIGHTTEGDIVKAGSVAGDYLGQQVASELVTMVDFANTWHGETLPVPVYLDDEGVQSEDVTIIENGILKGFMHNKETATHFNTSVTGNARAYQYHDEPLVRMRNTAILPGTSKLDDMIASIDNGYYLMNWTNGQADSTSEFMFGVQMGYEIKDGKLGRAVSDTTISGIAFELLKDVSMLSDEMVWNCSGMCGKKQPLPVGMGGPAVKTKVFIGGQ